MLSRGIGKASVDNVIKVCKGLGITTDDLERLATQEDNTVKEEVSIYETIQTINQTLFTFLSLVL